VNLKSLAIGALLATAATPALAQEAPKLFFEGDVVRAAGPNAKGAWCVLNSQFKRGETAIFRIRVLDPRTGKSLDDKGVKSLMVELSNGEKLTAHYHQHPPQDPTDWFWVGGWPIAEDQPTGSISYKVVATTLDGQTVAWRPFQVAASQVTVIGD
jgi:hypothetical protein